MSAIEKLCLSSSANDFHVSLDIIFWREGSFFNYVEQVLPIISPTTYLPLVDVPLLLHIMGNLHNVDISSIPYLPPLFNVVKERPSN